MKLCTSVCSSVLESTFRTVYVSCKVLSCHLQVPDMIGGGRFPDSLEAETTTTEATEKALPKEKAT